MRQCNECEMFRCRKIESDWPDIRPDHEMSIYEMRADCPNYVPPKEFTQPLLLHLMADDRKVPAIMLTLASFGLKVKEKERYPYFDLALRGGGSAKKERKKGRGKGRKKVHRLQKTQGTPKIEHRSVPKKVRKEGM